MARTILPLHIVRDLNREIDKASEALFRVMERAETLREKLDTEDATAHALSAMDALDDVHDAAEELEEQLNPLFDHTDKLRRFSRIIVKRRK